MPLKLSDRKKKTQNIIQWEKFRQHIPDDSNLNGRNSTGTYAGTCLKIGEKITHFFGTSSFRYRKLRKTLILIEILQAIKFRWVLDGSKSTGSSVRMWVSGTKGNKTKYSAFEAYVQKCKEQSIERDSRAGSSIFYFVFLIEQFQPTVTFGGCAWKSKKCFQLEAFLHCKVSEARQKTKNFDRTQALQKDKFSCRPWCNKYNR